jgi:hypothetical protein
MVVVKDGQFLKNVPDGRPAIVFHGLDNPFGISIEDVVTVDVMFGAMRVRFIIPQDISHSMKARVIGVTNRLDLGITSMPEPQVRWVIAIGDGLKFFVNLQHDTAHAAHFPGHQKATITQGEKLQIVAVGKDKPRVNMVLHDLFVNCEVVI